MKNVLITGSSSGIGAETARLFSENGYYVHLHGRDSARLEMVAHKLSGPSTIHKVDLADSKALSFWLDRLVEDEIPLDCIVNNAGVFSRASFLDTTGEELRRQFEVNVFALADISRSLYPLLKKQKGNLINVGSTVSLRPIPMTSAYTATKAALVSLTEIQALEWAPDVRVNCVCPGIVDTPIHQTDTPEDMNDLQPMKRIGTPLDIAKAIWFLADESSSSWTTGSVLPVSGGIHLV